MSLLASAILGLIVIGATLGAVPYLILLERKVAAYVQDRLGPNRVGPRGIFQPIADGLKIFFKEHFIPGQANRFLFILGPSLSMLSAMAVLAVIPFAGVLTLPRWDLKIPIQIVPNLDIGIIYVVFVAIGSVYGTILGGWASNNKYSFYGALRSVSQILCYEIPLGLCLLAAFLIFADLRLERAVLWQTQHGWLVIYQPVLFGIMAVCTFAETNRLPFDTPEAEQELVAGYHTEYSSMEFGLFFLGEYAHLIAAAALLVTVFFGGWHFPYLTPGVEGSVIQTLVKLAVFSAKVLAVIFVFMWVRWTLPRFRFDQSLRVGWQLLLPLALALLVVTTVLAWFGLAGTIWMTLANVGVLAGTYGWFVLKDWIWTKKISSTSMHRS